MSDTIYADTEADNTVVIVEVLAGVIPERPDPAHTRRYALTSGEWNNGYGARRLAEINGQAQGYASYLMLQPALVNWVRVDWIWL